MKLKTLSIIAAVLLVSGPQLSADAVATIQISVNLAPVNATELVACIEDESCNSSQSGDTIVEFQDFIANNGQTMVRVVPI